MDVLPYLLCLTPSGEDLTWRRYLAFAVLENGQYFRLRSQDCPRLIDRARRLRVSCAMAVPIVSCSGGLALGSLACLSVG
jgi:hypothetical protein